MSQHSLRNFTEDSPIKYCFTATIAPLIKIDIDGNFTYYKTKAQKIAALKEAKPTDKFIMAWGGQWSTDVFNVSQSDIDYVLSNY